MKKRAIAILMAAVMAVSMGVNAFAASTEPNGDNPTEITGGGNTEYEDTEVFLVTLPTISSWDFKLDPQGLAGLEKDASATEDELAVNAGKIIQDGEIPKVVNQSSIPITLSVKLKVTGDVVTLEDDEDLEADTEHNILLNVVASKGAVDAETVIDSSDEDNFAFEGDAAGTFPLLKTEQIFKFVLEGAAYKFNRDNDGALTYDMVDGELGKGTMLKLDGSLNKKADWADFAEGDKEVGIAAVFSFDAATEEEITAFDEATTKTTVYGYIGHDFADLNVPALEAAIASLTEAITDFETATGSVDKDSEQAVNDALGEIDTLEDVIETAESLLANGDIADTKYDPYKTTLSDLVDDAKGLISALEAELGSALNMIELQGAIADLTLAISTFGTDIDALDDDTEGNAVEIQTAIDDFQAVVDDMEALVADEKFDGGDYDALKDELSGKITDAKTAIATAQALLVPPIVLLSGTTGDTELTAIPNLSSNVVFRIGGLEGKTAANVTKITMGGIDLTKTTHYTVSMNAGLIQITLISAKAWINTTTTNTAQITVDGEVHDFNILLGAQ